MSQTLTTYNVDSQWRIPYNNNNVLILRIPNKSGQCFHKMEIQEAAFFSRDGFLLRHTVQVKEQKIASLMNL